MITRLQSFIEKHLGQGVKVENALLLTGGASQETWRIDVEHKGSLTPYCLRRAKDSESEQALDLGGVGLMVEAELIQAARSVGVKAPQIVALINEEDDLGIGFLMQWLEGETLGHKIARAQEFASIRPELARQCGEQLALIHSMDTQPFLQAGSLQKMAAVDFIQQTYDQYLSLNMQQPMLDYTARYLLENAPRQHDYVLNHGDFRSGNLMVDPNIGISAVLDWELASIADPAKDIAWLCVNSWRFGCNEFVVGGFGDLDDLLTAYNANSGRKISADDIHYWMVFGSFWWSVCCLSMGNTYKTGVNTSLERPIIGRRASEGQLDCVNLLLPQSFEIIPDEQNQALLPTDAELAEALQAHLKDNVAPLLSGKDKFLAQVAANAAGILARSARFNASAVRQANNRLQALLGDCEPQEDLNAKLCEHIREGLVDLDNLALQAHLRATVEAQVLIDQPQYVEFSKRGAG
ncbi:phosphotransferase family protein [Aequoribacter sp.]|uniref:phosphotransferase family protein n=1 Tax=Aequoribacter sp. TaxID=2847771 RepID=UPI003F69F114